MDGNVATGAIPTGLEPQPAMGHTHLLGKGVAVTLETEKARFSTSQQEARIRPMRGVADGATFDAYRRMFEEKGSLLVDVARGAGLPPWGRQRGAIRTAMCVVALGALHRLFGHSMVKRLRELRASRGMARIAQCRLRLLQQAFAKPSLVDLESRNGEELR